MKFLQGLSKKKQAKAKQVMVALALFVVISLIPLNALLPSPYALYVEFALYLVPYLLAGHDVLRKAVHNIRTGQMLDENFLMCVATVGAFALVLFPEAEPHMAEGAAVMLFFQVGELFEDYAVAKSRRSIAQMMDIAPEGAWLVKDGTPHMVSPEQVVPGDLILVKPGERVPLDGVVVEGSSRLDTAALTGEAVPRGVEAGSDCVSGCVNLTGAITVRVSKPYAQSTVARILDLVENASEKKARTESFITRFARVYTPVVVAAAVLLAVVPPLLMGQPWADWVQRGLIFLVVSCPCALVISVPLSFFGGIGGASRLGILVKGGNYLESLAKVQTVVFDKTGTLTTGTFQVTDVQPARGTSPAQLLQLAAKLEAYSNHPIAHSVCQAARQQGVASAATDPTASEFSSASVTDVHEESGHGMCACVDGRQILVGNAKLMRKHGIDCSEEGDQAATVVHVACGGEYLGRVLVADAVKIDAAQAIADLRAQGVKRTVMLSGDVDRVAQSVSGSLGLDECRSQLLPDQKVEQVEHLLAAKGADGTLAFVGDGINDAPVLMLADVGIAMGALGSDAAIEAADVVLMDDAPSKVAKAIALARRTMAIVWQNIIFAIGVKLIILALAALGMANMWLAVFGDVGVSVIAILNAMRALKAVK